MSNSELNPAWIAVCNHPEDDDAFVRFIPKADVIEVAVIEAPGGYEITLKTGGGIYRLLESADSRDEAFELAHEVIEDLAENG